MQENTTKSTSELTKKVNRLEKAVKLLLTSVFVLSATCLITFTLALYLNNKRVSQINSERYRNTLVACVNDSSENKTVRGIVQFAASDFPLTELLKKTEEDFPVLTYSECVEKAKDKVSK